MRLSECFNLYKSDYIVFRNQSKKTEENHDIALRSLLNYMGDIDVYDLDFPLVREWKEWLSKNRSPNTVRGYIIKLRVVLSYMRTIKVDCLDPERIPVPKRAHAPVSFLTSEQVSTLIESTSSIRARAILSLLYASGIRVSELCSMNRGDIHEGCFTVTGKGDKPRLCFVDDRASMYIRMYEMTRKDNNEALFIARQKKQRMTPGNVQEIFKHARKKAGIPDCHPHTMRHSFATNLLRNNANMRYVQVMLGHESLQTTAMYSHYVDLDLQRIYKESHTV